MNNIDIMNFWINESDKDYENFILLYNHNRYSFALFTGHLVIEKLLKALYAKNNRTEPHAPRSHDLNYLANKCEMNLTEEQDSLLEEITRFSMSGRYDDYKMSFSKLCTKEYTTEKKKNIEEVREWLKTLLKDGKQEK